MKQRPFYLLIGSVVLTGAVGCQSAQSHARSFNQIPPATQIVQQTENSTQSAETSLVAHSTKQYAPSNLSNSSGGTSIGRLPIPTMSRNPRLCTTG